MSTIETMQRELDQTAPAAATLVCLISGVESFGHKPNALAPSMVL